MNKMHLAKSCCFSVLLVVAALLLQARVSTADNSTESSGPTPNKFSPDDFKFDFNTGRYYANTVGLGGEIINAVLPPADKDGHASIALVNLKKPGSLNMPHNHPRASEVVLVTKGIIRLGVACPKKESHKDNGDYSNEDLEVEEFDLIANSVGFVPKSCIHFEINIGHGPAAFVAFFDDENPGTVTYPTSLFALKTFAEWIDSKKDADDDLSWKIKASLPKNVADLSPHSCDALDHDVEHGDYAVKSCGYSEISEYECKSLGCCFFVKDYNSTCLHPFAHSVLPLSKS